MAFLAKSSSVRRAPPRGARSGKEVTMVRIETVELPLVPESSVQKEL